MAFQILAHRGASAYYPENTLPSFYRGLELGGNGLETDLQMSKDGVIYLFHDDVMGRTSTVKGKTSDYTWEELKQIDVGSWLSPKWKNERLVTFEEFMYHFSGKDIILAIELKAAFTAEQFKPVLAIINKYHAWEKVTITSFIYQNLLNTREVDKKIKMGYLMGKTDMDVINQLKSIGAQQICPDAQKTTAEDVELAKRHGLEVRAWNIANTDVMEKSISMGVDGMTVNFPDKLAEALAKRK
jgi:glycerophosphoryl diester phosphodiesterase